MLNTLKPLSRSDAELVLASMVDRLTPSPGTNPQSMGLLADPAVTDQAIEELLHRFKVGKGEIPRQKRARLLDFLSKEFDRLEPMPPGKNKEIMNDLGQKGILPPSQYKVKLLPTEKMRYKLYGFVEKEILESIHRPDFTEHFFPSQYGIDSETAFTITHKRFCAGSNPARNLLSISQRHGSRYLVMRSFVIFSNSEEILIQPSLKAVLERFVEVFGSPIEIEGRKKLLYFLEKVKNVSKSKKPIDLDSIKHHYDVSILYRLPEKNDQPSPEYFDIGYAFQIDRQKYADYLKGHGIKQKN